MRLNIINMLLVFVYKLLLDISYVVFVNPYFEYMGFTLDLNWFKLLLSYLVLFILLLLIKEPKKRFSSVAIILLFLFMVVPTLTIYAMKNESSIFFFTFILGFILTIIISRLPYIRVCAVRNKSIICIISGSITLLTYGILIYFNGLPSLNAFNLSNGYDIRSNINLGLGITGYLYSWQGNVINLLLVGVGYSTRNYYVLTFGVILQLLLFMITAHKLFLILPIFIIVLIFAVKSNKFLYLTTFSLIGTIMISLLMLTIDQILPASLFIRRALLVPAQIYFNYYDFFSENSLTYLSQSIFKVFIENPYSEPIPYIIGEHYLSDSSTWVNTGYFGDAYMNFGLMGMIIFSIILGLILLLTDSVSKNKDTAIPISVMGAGIYNLVNGALLTTLLTGGLLLAIVLVYFSSNNNEHQLV